MGREPGKRPSLTLISLELSEGPRQNLKKYIYDLSGDETPFLKIREHENSMKYGEKKNRTQRKKEKLATYLIVKVFSVILAYTQEL